MQQQPGTQPPALALGSILLRRYSIDGYIGGGGFGYIYLASDLALGHRRAIKEAFCRDANAQHQFRLEAEFLLNARHPNLVRGYAVFEHNGRLYLVMDYVDGHTLEDIAIEHIRRTGRALPETQVLDWMIPICAAAYELHSQPVPVIHRDIKPANIKQRTSDGAPILIDLGLAKLFAEGTQTLQAALAFTPGYAPPEQYQASGATDQRTDVYGLGASLFYLLTGYQPTEAPARVAAQALPAPRTLNALLSAPTEAIVLRAMALDPAQRFQTTRELEHELRAARAALNSPTVRPSMAGTAAGTAEATEAARLATGPVAAVSRRPCLRCGTANLLAARFCMRCGAPMSAPRGTGAPVARHAPGGVDARPMDRTAPNARGETGVFHVPRPRLDEWSVDRSAGVRGPWRPALAGQGTGSVEWAPIFPGSLAALLRGAEQSWPFAGSRRQARRVAAHLLSLGASASELEAWTSIASLLAVACLSLSLTAAFAWIMILFVVPALLLGHWCLAQPRERVPREFRWLSLTAVGAGYAWIVLWLVMLIAHIL